ncbi:MarR family winged helix-turn-helix transcriptional regulator [Psychromicrobium lacuslunae]|uniref:MarR family winged helix-turn-helix transcriptional regulator n=1 Tax=Psychromicrobium lacuslunae TaxID=1618207 RepID=UPI0009E2C808|nr:MarR family transcriptional regulator [Psychromicrobium lacuslunae]
MTKTVGVRSSIAVETSRDAEDSGLVEQWRSVQDAYLRTSNAIERELESQFSIGCSEFEILDLLAGHTSEQCRMKDLAVDSPLTQSALSRIVDRLEKAGLVIRAACTTDRRSMLVELTAKGCEVYDKAAVVQRSVLKDCLEPKSPTN